MLCSTFTHECFLLIITHFLFKTHWKLVLHGFSANSPTSYMSYFSTAHRKYSKWKPNGTAGSSHWWLYVVWWLEHQRVIWICSSQLIKHHRRKEGKIKKFSWSCIVFIGLVMKEWIISTNMHRLWQKNNNSFHVAIHSVNHDNKIQCFIYSNWSIFMSFEWQSAQFGVHHDPKSFNWQTKSQSQALVEDRWKSVAMNATKSTSMLTPFLHICHVF